MVLTTVDFPALTFACDEPAAPVDNGGGGGGSPPSGPTELAYAGFSDGTYRLNGASAVVGDLLIQDSGNGYNFVAASDIAAGTGLTGTSPGSGSAYTTSPRFSDALCALMNTASPACTLVFDVMQTAAEGVPNNSALAVDVELWSADFGVNYGISEGLTAYLAAPNGSATPSVTGAGHHKFAFLFNDGQLAVSVDGAAAVTFASDPWSVAMPFMGLNFSSDDPSNYIASMTVFAAVNDADLPALSTAA